MVPLTVGGRSDVIVVGAGLAGLHAAFLLERGGARVQVLEARPHVGGRVLSMRQQGHHQEAGGAYIGAGYRRLAEVVGRSGVELVDVTTTLSFFREQDLVLDGELIPQSDWPEHPRNTFPDKEKTHPPWSLHRTLAMRENPLPSPESWLDPQFAGHDVPVRDWLLGLGFSPSAVRLGYDLNPGFGSSAGDASALLLFFRAAFSHAQRGAAPDGVLGYTAKGGVQRIPEAMAEQLENEVHCNRAVTAITSDRHGTTIRCAGGQFYAADRVVCALPFSVLRHIAIDPPLAGLQHEAVGHLDSQPVTQLYFAHRSSFWLKDGHAPSMFTDGPAGMVAAARNGNDPKEVTSFTVWAMGPLATRLDSLNEEDAANTVRQAIEAVRPAARGQLEFLGAKSWGTDPCAKGAWAYFKPGQIARFAATMGQTHGRIHFCGEHLARTARGMEGALESSEETAREILSA